MRGHNEGSIYRRSQDGKWVAQIGVGYSASGRRRYARRVRDTRRQALDALGELQRRQTRSTISSDLDTQRMGDYLKSWLAGIEASVAPRTWQSYESTTRLHIVPVIGHVPLGKVGPQHVTQTLTAARASGLSSSSVRYVRTVLSIALQQATDWRVLESNPAKMVKAPRVERSEAQWLTVDQARQVLAALEGDRLEALYTVAVAVGLRVSEALGIRWGDVDLDKGVLHARKQLARDDGEYALAPLKGRRARDIPLPRFAVDAMREHRAAWLDERRRADYWHDQWGLAFVTYGPRTRVPGSPLNRTWVLRHLERRCVAAGAPVPKMHELRHTCASLLLAQRVPLPEIQQILGHSSITITRDIYAHLEVEHLRSGLDALGDLLDVRPARNPSGL